MTAAPTPRDGERELADKHTKATLAPKEGNAP